MAVWDRQAAPIDTAATKDSVLYVGFDLSQVDDLSAVVWVWVTPERFYVDSHFWLPKSTAAHYQEKHAIPFDQWADAGHVTLVDEPTISQAVRKQIAASIIDRTKGYTLKAVTYDRYKSDDTIATLEAARLTCVPVAQGYSVSPGAQELERRLKEGSITIASNPVLRWNAENVEIKSDDRGNIWPCKPHAKGRYAGYRAAKIDGISALVTALTEARKFTFPAARKMFKGTISLCRAV
jgi:phage terminase large subunit-like protein